MEAANIQVVAQSIHTSILFAGVDKEEEQAETPIGPSANPSDGHLYLVCENCSSNTPTVWAQSIMITSLESIFHLPSPNDRRTQPLD